MQFETKIHIFRVFTFINFTKHQKAPKIPITDRRKITMVNPTKLRLQNQTMKSLSVSDTPNNQNGTLFILNQPKNMKVFQTKGY